MNQMQRILHRDENQGILLPIYVQSKYEQLKKNFNFLENSLA